jgi:hypothetical protein
MNKKENLPSVSSETKSLRPTSEDINSLGRGVIRRRSFLKRLGMAGATLLPAGALLMTKGRARADQRHERKGNSQRETSRFYGSWLRLKSSKSIFGSNITNWEESVRPVL